MDEQQSEEELVDVKLTYYDISVIKQVIKVILHRGTPVGYAGDDDEGIDVDEDDMKDVLAKLKQYGFDVHTEHCCKKHGCKYCDPNCTVTTGKKKQSHPCEQCYIPEYETRYKGPETVDFVDWDEDGEP